LAKKATPKPALKATATPQPRVKTLKPVKAPKPPKTLKAPKPKPRRQFAALPYRIEGDLEVLLVTTRETGRWVIPKGWPMVGKTPRAAAAREALEEAGVIGKPGRRRLGAYTYPKVLKSGETVICRVTVFPLAVNEQKADWRERDQRQTRWFPPNEAAEAVNEPGLSAIIRDFGEDWRRRERHFQRHELPTPATS
jgi:8-oxo-dGTP pyrophosphatase MutT (NUDIX family)